MQPPSFTRGFPEFGEPEGPEALPTGISVLPQPPLGWISGLSHSQAGTGQRGWHEDAQAAGGEGFGVRVGPGVVTPSVMIKAFSGCAWKLLLLGQGGLFLENLDPKSFSLLYSFFFFFFA